MFLTLFLLEAAPGASATAYGWQTNPDIGRAVIAHRVDNSKAPLEPGTWGGEHVRLEVTADGGQLDFDCAHGSIRSPIRPDERGRFEVAGELVRESPGPIRVGHEPKCQPASYSGTVDGKRMSLRVTLKDSGQAVGEYSLELGSPGRIHKCR